jgi:hypothetical protein
MTINYENLSRRARCAIAGCVFLLPVLSYAGAASTWVSNGAPVEATITGGPWTLEQSGAGFGQKSAGYCDGAGNQIGNPGTERMQPYYFPSISGTGNHLQGYFDWRPKDIDEAVVAADSNDGGISWTFQQKVLELRSACPNIPAKSPDSGSPIPDNMESSDDDGQGHQFVMHISGHTYLYTLNRASNHIDADGLVVHEIMPQIGAPLSGAPALSDVPNDTSPPGTVDPTVHTVGLLNPDGILGAIPETSPQLIVYEQKILSGDNTGTTAFPAAQQCATSWSDFYKSHGKLSPNDDITYLRSASTTDGIHFTDLGPLQGLNDPTTVSATGTRWLATAGTLLQFHDRRFGLFFSGGNCMDADSDSFHYIGYAESSDLIHWTVLNGIENPIASVAPMTIAVNAQGVPTGSTQSVTIPATKPIVGNALGWFAGRVYAPSATRDHSRDVNIVFAGYHTQKPKNGLGDYRTIGQVSLHTSSPLRFVGQGEGGDSGDGD